MIKLLLFDLEDTLVHQDALYPWVVEALTALAGFETPSGDPLILALLSRAESSFQVVVSLLERHGLRQFFEPVERRVTLSSQQDEDQPLPAFIHAALTRLDRTIDADEYVFVSGNPERLALARSHGIATLGFGAESDRAADFGDWSEAPLLLARMVGADQEANLESALAVGLSAQHHIDLLAIAPGPGAMDVKGRGKRWWALSSSQLGELSGVRVPIPVELAVHLDARGRIDDLKATEPSSDELAETTHFVERLVAQGKVEVAPGRSGPGTTHQVDTDAQGHRYLVRKRFSARES